MWFHRRRSDRPDSAKGRLPFNLESLEGRTLLSSDVKPLAIYQPHDLSVYYLHTDVPTGYNVKHQLLSNPSTQSPLLGNEGKIVSGKDRQGDEWTIVVHGPGTVIVTDTSPGDGSNDDAIDTIQIINSDINRTYVTGNVVGSFRVQTNGTIPFNKLVATQGVHSIVLNGFSLAQTVAPVDGGPNNLNTGIFLLGGVRYLSFHDIIAPIDQATNDAPINVVIGDPNNPLTVQPSIHLDSIFNTVFNSTATTVPPITPVTTPTVNLIVNGQIRDLSFISTTADTVPAGQAFLFPTVASTGRTAVQTIGINNIRVAGAATNFTASRASQPFQNGFSGLNHLKTGRFNGPTDAVGIDVNGNIGGLSFRRGLGNPTGVFVGQNANGSELPATLYGTPQDQYGYAAAGLVGSQVTATQIGHLNVGPANVTTQSPSNPDFTQITRQGSLFTVARPGNALTNALVTSAKDIGRVHIVGNSQNSEIKSGFHYNSFAAGLEGTRAKSKIGRLIQAGSLINGVNSATYRPFLNVYGTPVDTAGPGKITGTLSPTATVVTTGGVTPLGNIGAGNFARVKKGGYLPPPQSSTRINGVLYR